MEIATHEMSEKKRRILQAAIEVFGESPFHQVKIEHIAERAGVGKGTIYEYFRSKEELFASMAMLSAQIYFRNIFSSVKDGQTVTEKLRGVFHSHLSFIQENTDVARILAGERRLPQTGFRELAKERRKQMEVLISGLLREGVAAGEFRAIDIDVTTQVILGTLTALWVYVLFEEHTINETQTVVEKILDFYLHGLATHENP